MSLNHLVSDVRINVLIIKDPFIDLFKVISQPHIDVKVFQEE